MDATHLWCQRCGSIKPMKIEVMPGRSHDNNYVKPTDLICAECCSVACTTFKEPTERKD